MTGLEQSVGRELAATIEREVKAMERRFNCHDERSPLSVVNLRAAGEAVEVDDDMFMALDARQSAVRRLVASI